MIDAMPGSVPFYLSAQLKSGLNEIRELALQKGLEQVFQIELFAIERDVTEALANDDLEAAGRAQQRLRALEAQMRATPDKNDGLLLR